MSFKLTNSSLLSEGFTSQVSVLNLLDFCKGFALTLILLYHYQTILWFGWQGVPIFIVLSGLGLTYSCLRKKESISWKQWYLKRAKRILPAYWLVVLFGFLAMVSMHMVGLTVELRRFTIQTIFDLLLFRNFYFKTIAAPPNVPLWFVPMIISFYLVFPCLYTQLLKGESVRRYQVILLVSATVEFIYRAISLYYLDGLPFSYNLVVGKLSLSGLPLDKLGDNFPFQGFVPFGFFPSVVGEFMLGMTGATFLFKNPKTFHKILLNPWMGITGVFIWLCGTFLLKLGLWGWVFSDFVIALGLILWVVNLAQVFQHRLPAVFERISQLGKNSYYIYLSHGIFIYISETVETKFLDNTNLLNLLEIKVCMLLFIIIGTGISSWLVMKFDRYKSIKLIKPHA